MSCDDLFTKGEADGGQENFAYIDPDGYKIGKIPIKVRCFKGENGTSMTMDRVIRPKCREISLVIRRL